MTHAPAKPLTAESPAARITKARWFPILALVFVATMINYLNRTVFGIAKPLLVSDLHIDPVWAGLLGSAFQWSYAAAQLPAGALLDRLGTRLTYTLSLVVWSIFTIMQGVVSGVGAMIGARVGLGLFEAPCFPANSRVLAHWFPQHERARANSIYSVGMFAGIAFLSVPLFWLTETYGWRALFILTGVAGVVFGLLWYLVYREPHDSALANQAELDYIVAGGGLKTKGAKARFKWSYVKRLLSSRLMISISVAQFGTNAVLTFFLIDFVNYLIVQRHMAFLSAGFFAALPYMAAAIGVLVGGQISDQLLRRGKGANLARKLPIATGLLLAACLPIVNYIPEGKNWLVILVMSIVFFGQGASNLGWTVLSDVAPQQLVGLSAGFFNLITNLSGIITPILIGVILQYTGSYDLSFAFIGALPLLGALLYIFAMGDIKRMEFKE